MDAIIIGGGASGLVCAIEAAKRGKKVCIVERMDRVGKKILATGNGRCNLLNRGKWQYPMGREFAAKVLKQCDAAAQTAFWNELGVNLREEDGGRVYPVSGQASTVLDALRNALQLFGVDIITGFDVKEIHPAQKGYQVISDHQQLNAAKVVVAGGGKAQSKLGSNGSALRMLQACGHHTTKEKPVLTQLVCDTKPIAGLSGIRVKATVSVVSGNQVKYTEAGEVLFTDYGLSGVCIMNCSCFARPGDVIRIDYIKGMGFRDRQDIIRELNRRKQQWQGLPLEQLMCGLCVNRLASAICKAAGVRMKDRTIASLRDSEIRQIASVMECMELTVKDIRGFDFAQVTGGGADPWEFDPTTMESVLSPGLYAAG